MKRLHLFLAAMLTWAPIVAWGADGDVVAEGSTVATPDTSAPQDGPMAVPSEPPAPPSQAQAPSVESQTSSQGQWVYTQQYGWIWMPYGDAYSYVPQSGEGTPYAYVYYPSYGWSWVVAPWIWGYGAWPYFGVVGPAHFGWYARGFWRSPGRWHFFRPGPFRGGVGFHRGFTFHGVGPGPRAGFVARSGGGHWGGGAHWGGGGHGVMSHGGRR